MATRKPKPKPKPKSKSKPKPKPKPTPRKKPKPKSKSKPKPKPKPTPRKKPKPKPKSKVRLQKSSTYGKRELELQKREAALVAREEALTRREQGMRLLNRELRRNRVFRDNLEKRLADRLRRGFSPRALIEGLFTDWDNELATRIAGYIDLDALFESMKLKMKDAFEIGKEREVAKKLASETGYTEREIFSIINGSPPED